jgi:PAS domain S-box-containing protein
MKPAPTYGRLDPDMLLGQAGGANRAVATAEGGSIAAAADRARSGIELRTLYAQLQQLLDHSPVVIYLLRIEGELQIPTVVSENIASFLGFTVAETMSDDWWPAQLHPEDCAAAFAAVQTTRSTGQGRSEYRIRHKDGSYRWVEDTMRLVRDDAGESTGIVGVWADITARKQAEDVLRAGPMAEGGERTGYWWESGVVVVLSAISTYALFVSEPMGAPLALGLLLMAMALLFYRHWTAARGETARERRIQTALRTLHAALDTRVQQRTAELAKANDALRAEVAERARTEAALGEERALMRAMIDQIPDLIYVKDSESRFLLANESIARVLGVASPAELLGKTDVDFHPEARAKAFRADELRVLAGEAVIEKEEFASDGSGRVFLTTKVPRRDTQGRVTGVIGLGHEITNRRRAEEELRQQQEQWRMVVTASPNAVFVVQDERIVLANPAALEMFGATARDGLIGRYALELVHEDYREMVRARMQQASEHDGPLPLIEQKFRRLEGGVVDVESNSVRFQFQGRPALLVEARDIRERKRGELRLKLQHSVTTALAEAESPARAYQRMLAMVCRNLQLDFGELWRVDRNAKVLRCIEVSHVDAADLADLASATRMATFPPGQGLAGRVWASGQAEWISDISLVTECERRTLATRVGLHGWIGFPIKLRDEVLGVVGFFSAQIKQPDEQMLLILSALGSQLGQFIERQELADQFRQAQKMEAVGTLAGGIAHDFNNIIAAMIGYSELAKMELGGNVAAQEHIDAVLVGAARATLLVRQILSFCRQQENERKPIQLRHIVTEALNLLRATIPTTIEFSYSFDADLPAVLADATQVHQIVMNLGTNAWHAMKDRPGRLEVKLAHCDVDATFVQNHPALRVGKYVRLSIGDTGHGMDEFTLQRIFEPFFTTKAPGEGTGLGLAVVHGIMQSHEGLVTVYSHPGEGTVFHLYFPTCIQTATPGIAGDVYVPHGQGERLLYVDDEAPLAKMGEKILQRLGYVVEAHTNPMLALQAVRAAPERYDLVITDLTMPGMTGTELAQELLSIRADLPVILTTGYTATLTAARAQAEGIREMLLKPLSVQALGDAVARVLAGSKKTS